MIKIWKARRGQVNLKYEDRKGFISRNILKGERYRDIAKWVLEGFNIDDYDDETVKRVSIAIRRADLYDITSEVEVD